MKIFSKIWSAVYHLWYYVVIFISIVLIFPGLFLTSINPKNYRNFFFWSGVWGKIVLIGMGLGWRVRGFKQQFKNQTYVIIANHSSELDIMLMFAIVKNPFVFIGKKELAKMPVFGYFYKRTNILVDRKSLASKRDVLHKAAKRIDEGVGICIFPEGGIPDAKHKLAPFKAGAFKLAIEKQIPILPITFKNNRRHFNEFFDGGYPGILKVMVHEPIETTGLTADDINNLSAQCFNLLYTELAKKD